MNFSLSFSYITGFLVLQQIKYFENAIKFVGKSPNFFKIFFTIFWEIFDLAMDQISLLKTFASSKELVHPLNKFSQVEQHNCQFGVLEENKKETWQNSTLRTNKNLFSYNRITYTESSFIQLCIFWSRDKNKENHNN